jgi:N-acyl-D-amino-acid deacylase
MGFDLLIRNGTVVDGTGGPAYEADVAVVSGKIMEVGKGLVGKAQRVIDASNLIVSPGFVDPHTHYDAQICWDPQVTSSSWNGVTTVLLGNCGVGIAPCKRDPQSQDVAAWDLVNLEAIPIELLKAALTWDWESFPQYMDAAQRRGTAINLAFLAPLTPFRHYVMGTDALERAATAEETVRIKALLREAVAAGAMGFSTTICEGDIGYQGKPIACRLANRDELGEYADALKQFGKGIIQIRLTQSPGTMTESEYQLLDFLVNRAGGQPITWSSVRIREDRPDQGLDVLEKVGALIKRRAIPQVTCRPLMVELNLHEPLLFSSLPCGKQIYNRPVEEQKKVYRDPEFRKVLREELNLNPIHRIAFFAHPDEIEIVECAADPSLTGKSLADAAKARNQDPFDTLIELPLRDDLKTRYLVPLFASEETLPILFNDPRTLIGLADGGAHLDQICDAGYCTYLLGKWVRDRKALTLEYAVKRLTSEPAALLNLQDRGRIAPNFAADITIFDFDKVDSPKKGVYRNDLPGGHRRLVAPAQGIAYVIVNGVPVHEHNQYTNATPGTVLRSR